MVTLLAVLYFINIETTLQEVNDGTHVFIKLQIDKVVTAMDNMLLREKQGDRKT